MQVCRYHLVHAYHWKTCLSMSLTIIYIYDLSQTRTNMHAKCKDKIEIHEKLVSTIGPNPREVFVTILV